jgi:hypothetical protein
MSQPSEFCRHNPLCYFSTNVYCCLLRYDSVWKLLDTLSYIYLVPLPRNQLQNSTEPHWKPGTFYEVSVNMTLYSLSGTFHPLRTRRIIPPTAVKELKETCNGCERWVMRLGSSKEQLWEEHLQRRHCFYSWIPHFCCIHYARAEQRGTGNCPHGCRPPGASSLYFMSSILRRNWILKCNNRLSHRERTSY